MPKPELTEEEKAALHNVTSALSNRQEVRSVIDNAIPGICKALGIPPPEKKGKGKKSDKDSTEAKQPADKDKKPKSEKAPKPPTPETPQDIDSDEEERAIAQLDDLLNSSSGEESSAEEGTEAPRMGRKATGAEAKEATKAATAKTAAAVKRVLSKELDPMEITDEEDADEEGSAEDYDDLDPMEITEDEDDGEEDEDSGSIPDDAESSSEFEGFSDAPQEPESDNESSSSSLSPLPKKKKSKPQASEPAPLNTGGSAFFPSLMAGYISGSESEASDIDVAPSTHKNRRGQRARQAIWEKKFKEQAKHLKKQQEKRDSGWDAKRGAVGGDYNKPWKRGIRNPLASDANAVDLGPAPRKEPVKKRDDTGPLHPSWEAKRKAKEAQSASVPFQGKKITFD